MRVITPPQVGRRVLPPRPNRIAWAHLHASWPQQTSRWILAARVEGPRPFEVPRRPRAGLWPSRWTPSGRRLAKTPISRSAGRLVSPLHSRGRVCR
jgi:hypothetical protein